jgi:hypothetical protein
MNKVNNFLNEIPSWLVTMIIAITVSYVTIQLKVNTLEANYATIKEQIQTVKNDKADKVLVDETIKRLDRIENKLDKALSK